MKKLLATLFILVSAAGFLFADDADTTDYSKLKNLQALLESDRTDYLFLDVRTPKEYEAGHIPGAENISHERLPAALPDDVEKDDLIIVYCRSGNRSGRATAAMMMQGYSNVHDFGSVYNWRGDLER